ncbi:MAG: type VI secretion system lipoprotein TssJ [Rhizobiaceae bacterium]|nr:type VI secretion system lipoprotein TssJ [Rhizobiaceae bacterium]
MNRRIVIAGIAGLLSGCGLKEAAPKIAKIMKDPKLPVGPQDDAPKKIDLYAYAAPDVNRNFDGEPSPVVVKIFALSSEHRLFALDFFSIVNDPKGALGVTLTEELDENMMEPAAYKLLGSYEIPKKAKKLAVVAEYLDIDNTNWRASIDVSAAGDSGRLLMLLWKNEVQLTNGEKAKSLEGKLKPATDKLKQGADKLKPGAEKLAPAAEKLGAPAKKFELPWKKLSLPGGAAQ